jgi:hypothetical protein
MKTVSSISDFIGNYKREIGVSLSIICIAFILYANALGHGFIFSWDDFDYVLNNKDIRGFTLTNLKAVFTKYYVGNYAPVHLLSYMIDFQLWGLDPVGYHAANILLHAVNGILIYRLFIKLDMEHLPSFFGALIFVVHPVQVESVAWVTERKNILSVLFFLLALLCYIDYRQLVSGRFKNFVLSLVFIALGLMAKSAAVIFPAVLVVYDWCYVNEDRRLKLLNYVPFALLSLGTGILTLMSQDAKIGGGIRDFPGGTPVTTLWTMIPVLVTYIRELFSPLDLSPYYIIAIRKTLDNVVLSHIVALLVMGIVAAFMIKRWPRILFFFSIYLISLLPVMQIVPLITLKNDRYQYFPMIGAAGAAALIFSVLVKQSRRVRYATIAIAVAICISLSSVTYRQSLIWKDSITLWKFALEQNPENMLAWAMLAKGYTHLRNVSEAVRSLNNYNALKLKYGPLRGWEGM